MNRLRIVCWLFIVVMLLSGCGASTPGPGLDTSALPAVVSPLFPATIHPPEIVTQTIVLPFVALNFLPTVEPVRVPDIYNCDGALATTEWLTETFGVVAWEQSAGAMLSALRCSIGPAVLVAHVERAGKPAADAVVILYWSGAPSLPEPLWNCGRVQGVYGSTNGNGDIGFGLGPGSYYWPPGGGPHEMWVGSGSDCLTGLGMIAATQHQHLNSDWTLLDAHAQGAGEGDWGFSPGSVVYPEKVNGRVMPVVVWPGLGFER